MRSSLLQDLALSKAVAVRLLAYPLLTLRPAAVELAYGPFVTHMVGGGDEPESVSFEPMLPFASGKSCTFTARPDELHHALQKCPLHVMYVDVAPGGPPSVRGAAFMRLEIQDPDDASADIKTNAVETLALYDGSSRRMGHITLAARLGDRPDLDLSASFASDGGDILTDYSASPDREEPSVPSILKRPSVQHAAAPGRSLFPTESFMADAGICDASFEADPAQGITTGGEFDASNAAANRPSNQDSPGDGPYLTSFTGGGTQTFQSVATAATATRAPGAILAVRRPYRNSSGS
ncbi:hypothetical protein WJX72_009721 [[Myrmecia] bisecta]|uniref:Uncharacterized protein n=1 Tax=[Myrmecia] bisecta TaxID=41462 RepID=A0AAW1QBW5_9CHLO